MMQVQVKFFASLRERFGDERSLEVPEKATVATIWQQATEASELPGNVLCAVNMEYVDATTAVKGDDEVAFFPPVTGG